MPFHRPSIRDLEVVLREPIFTVQHTRFGCGSVVKLLLVVSDADGYFQLMRDLAELYRDIKDGGEPPLAHPPHIKAYMSNWNPMRWIRRNGRLLSTTSLRCTQSMRKSDHHSLLLPRLSLSGSYVSRCAELAAIKKEATDSESGGWVSTFEAISPYVYLHVHRARLRRFKEDPTQGKLSPTEFLAPLNLRHRLGPDYLPPRYFQTKRRTTHLSPNSTSIYLSLRSLKDPRDAT